MDVMEVDIGGIVAAHRRWFMFLAIVLIAAGGFALVFPLAGGLAVEVWTAVALIVAGVAQVVHAFAARQWQGFLFGLLIGAIYLFTGVLFWMNPLKGVVALTLLLAISIFLDGVVTTMLAFRLRPMSNWIWMLVSGILGIVVGVLLWQQLPSSAGWALGLMLGLNLIMSGIAFAALANSAQPMSGSSSKSA